MAGAGHLKIFLGYASGVGKSFRMFDEARRRRERGQDIVIAGVQPVMPPEVEALLPRLEIIPLRAGNAIDVDAVLRRRPAVCFIDGLAYANPSGARNPYRWQDVLDVVHAGVKVIGSVNIQYVAELRNEIQSITGKPVADTVPLSFLQAADEIEIVDAPATGSASLSRLREIALVLAADIVDHQLNIYLEEHGIAQPPPANERILICLTPRANADRMIATATLIARRFHGELLAAWVRQHDLAPAAQAAIDTKLAAARVAGAKIEILEGEDPVAAILDFARARGVTQLFIGHTQRSGFAAHLLGSPVDRLIRRAEGMDLRIFPQ
jgi:two-component system sensor histidine kinase KdpD